MKNLFIIVTLVFTLTKIAYAVDDKVIVSGHFDRAPFDWRVGEKIEGAAVEILDLIFGELGLTIDAKYTGPWKRVLHNLQNGQIDIMTGVYVTPDREKFAVFTEPFNEDRVSVFVWKGKEFQFDTWEDLQDKTFGDIRGASRGKEFDAWREKHAKIEYVADNLQNIKKLETGRIDCFVTSHYPGLMFIKKMGYEGRIVTLKNPISKKNLYYAISKKSAYLKYLPQINKRIVELRKDGTIDKIVSKNLALYTAKFLYRHPQRNR